MKLNRTDIAMKDVFISWTGKDRELKDSIVEFLNSNHISCLESDESCSGDYRQWSKQAVGACSVFLLILTENTLKSQYVPIEIEELKKLDDWENRVVPVCMNMDLYQNHSWGLHESESAVILEDQFPTQQHLAAIFHKTIDLLIHRQYAIYCCQNNKEYATLTPLLGANKIAAKQYSYDSLYIPRSVTELDDQGQYIETIESPNELIKNDDILFISGPAGSGKTQYIHQIRNCADDNDLVISLSCAKTAQSSEDLLSCIFHEFERIAGIRTFYSVDNFKRLLNVKHLVLILDGMDEIATQAGTKKFVKKVDEFYASNSKNFTLIFTSRNSDDANTIALGGKTLRRFALNKLTDSEISKLSENLFLLFGSAERNNEFYIKLNDLDEEIRSNPLLLSQLAIVYQNTGEIPQSVIGIYDAVSKITFSTDLSAEFDSVPATYKEMLELELSSILKSFSQERYKLLSQGKNIEITKIFSKILKEKYAGESKARAEFLVEYLQNRSILIDGEFYHKMFLEYFTAVAYYEQAFDDYDEIENVDILNELFAHYDDAYWSAVIKLFLVKADSCIDENITEDLYDSILKHNKICEYTLLFDACRDLIRHKEQAQLVLVCDILSKSIDGTYPPYGPLFWYVPEYELYETAVLAAEKLSGNARALALVRDVCFIFGRKYTVADITDAVDGEKLYQAAKSMLSGVRDGLVELFCIGSTECTLGTDIYPRCFNIAEAKHFMEIGHGMFGRMSSIFEDELSLWGESYPELNGEYIGFVSCLYDKAEMERKLCEKPTVKVRGLALINTDDTVMDYVHFVRTSVRVLYVPENVEYLEKGFDLFMQIIVPVKIVEEMICYVPFNLRKVVVSEGIKILSEGLFKGQKLLREVYLPQTLIEIGESAFQGCENLAGITIPTSVMKIGDSAFQGCKNLAGITIPTSVIEIGDSAFQACKRFEKIDIPNSVKRIGRNALSYCENLHSVFISKTVTEIESGTFVHCAKLRSIEIPNSVSKIGSHAFMCCRSLNSISIPNSVTEIGNSAFEECSNLGSIVLSDSVTKIGFRAFKYCMCLTSVTIPDSVIEIGPSVFARCLNLKQIIIPASLKFEIPKLRHKIPSSAEIICKETGLPFFNDKCEKDITIEEGRIEISEGEFFCSDLEKVHLPKTLERIKSSAFESCEQLVSIFLPDSVKIIESKAFKDCKRLRAIFIPASVTEIGEEAFKDCLSLNDIFIANSITKISASLFANCSNLRTVSIPDSVSQIGSFAFSGCENLESVFISNNVTEIGNGAFWYCSNLNFVTIPDSVTKIGSHAFSWCQCLNSVNIPATITVIEHGTFSYCKKLCSIAIPDSVTIIETGAFESCESLKTISIPNSIMKIGDSAFAFCSGLTIISLPECVSELGAGAFCRCLNLTSLILPNSIVEIKRYTFEDCQSLVSMTIPDSVTKIGERAFADCISLDGIVIPATIEEIEKEAFLNCSSLSALGIPKNLTHIGDNAFAGCSGLTSVTLSANFKNDVARIFGDIDPSIIHWIE